MLGTEACETLIVRFSPQRQMQLRKVFCSGWARMNLSYRREEQRRKVTSIYLRVGLFYKTIGVLGLPARKEA